MNPALEWGSGMSTRPGGGVGLRASDVFFYHQCIVLWGMLSVERLDVGRFVGWGRVWKWTGCLVGSRKEGGERPPGPIQSKSARLGRVR
jgi:hypothetical protein